LTKKSKETGDGTYWARNRDSFIQSYGLEYEALKMILLIVLGYWFFVQFVGWILLVLYFACFQGEEDIEDFFAGASGRQRVWRTLYLTVSAFQNNGLTLSSSSVEKLATKPFPLTILMLLILLGNTALPVCIYGIATLAYRWAKWRRNYDAYRAFGFLKLYPRKCYTHMFPWDNTVWLCFMIGLLTAVLTVALLWQDSSNLAFSHLSAVNTFTNTLFTAISTRTAGMNSIEVAQLSMSSTFLMIIWMYISALPTVVAMHCCAFFGASAQL